MTIITPQAAAREIAAQFRAIQERGGHAAIDFRNGELVLRCTQPQPNPKTWGRGAVPQPYTQEWVRICEC